MTTVPLAEMHEKLPDLLRRVAAGEQVILTEGGRWVAALTLPPPPPPTAAEEAASLAERLAAVESIIAWREQNGFSLPEGMTMQGFLDEARRRE